MPALRSIRENLAHPLSSSTSLSLSFLFPFTIASQVSPKSVNSCSIKQMYCTCIMYFRCIFDLKSTEKGIALIRQQSFFLFDSVFLGTFQGRMLTELLLLDRPKLISDMIYCLFFCMVFPGVRSSLEYGVILVSIFFFVTVLFVCVVYVRRTANNVQSKTRGTYIKVQAFLSLRKRGQQMAYIEPVKSGGNRISHHTKIPKCWKTLLCNNFGPSDCQLLVIASTSMHKWGFHTPTKKLVCTISVAESSISLLFLLSLSIFTFLQIIKLKFQNSSIRSCVIHTNVKYSFYSSLQYKVSSLQCKRKSQ